MATDNKELSRRILEEVWNKRNLDAADEMLAPNFVAHDPQSPMAVRSIDEYKQFVRYYLNAFPDSHFTVEDQIAEGQMVMTRWTVTSTHKGNLGAIPATGRKMSITGISCTRIENGKIAEGWTNWDTLGMLQQLGVVASQGQKAAYPWRPQKAKAPSVTRGFESASTHRLQFLVSLTRRCTAPTQAKFGPE